jgi:tetratricopeptide (TPR) repeat protein
VDGAIRAYRTAIECDPKYAKAHTNLGNALKAKGDVDGAIRCFRTAIECDPKDTKAHYNLGNALKAKGDVDEAIRCYRTAIACDPKYPEAHCNLGRVLQRQGQFRAALQSLQRGHELGSKRSKWRYPSAAWVNEAQQLLALDEKLAAILKGDAQPANAAERLVFARVCRYKQLYAASARFCADAFAEQPKLGDDPRTGERYDAACTAALAAAGRGEDAKSLPDKVLGMFRHRALTWLRADLGAYAQLAEIDNSAIKQAVRQRLEYWQKDPDLAGLREKEALGRLPEAERDAWRPCGPTSRPCARRWNKRSSAGRLTMRAAVSSARSGWRPPSRH